MLENTQNHLQNSKSQFFHLEVAELELCPDCPVELLMTFCNVSGVAAAGCRGCSEDDDDAVDVVVAVVVVALFVVESMRR